MFSTSTVGIFSLEYMLAWPLRSRNTLSTGDQTRPFSSGAGHFRRFIEGSRMCPPAARLTSCACSAALRSATCFANNCFAARAAPTTPPNSRLFAVSSFTLVGKMVQARAFMCFSMSCSRTSPALARPPVNTITSGSTTRERLMHSTARWRAVSSRTLTAVSSPRAKRASTSLPPSLGSTGATPVLPATSASARRLEVLYAEE
mmetsp:Transcript_39009/g.67520  ORF Transcript_39009/g.67520 Transcript_39009/m.67520 type:complete len:203 (-) Transcript_39009:613-1221(-)